MVGSAVVGPLGIVAVWLPFELAVLPEILVGPLETAFVIEFGASNLGHPKYFASPNVCSFASCASSLGLVGRVFVGSSIDALSNDAPYSRSSNRMVSLYKKMEHFDSSPNLNYSSANDTISPSHGRHHQPL